jgi:hypothetical protein
MTEASLAFRSPNNDLDEPREAERWEAMRWVFCLRFDGGSTGLMRLFLATHNVELELTIIWSP